MKNKVFIKELNEKDKQLKLYKEILIKKSIYKSKLPKEEQSDLKTINKDNPILDIAMKVLKNKNYQERKIKSAIFEGKVNNERLHRVINKVEQYLDVISKDSLEKEGTEEGENIKKDIKKGNIIDRLYKHKEKDKEQIEKNKTFIKDFKNRPKSVFKVHSIKEEKGEKGESKKGKELLVKLLKLPVLNEDNTKTTDFHKKETGISSLSLMKKTNKDDFEKMKSLNEKQKEELNYIIKTYGYDINELNKFKKKYNSFNIDSYLHKANINKIKIKKKEKKKSLKEKAERMMKMVIGDGKEMEEKEEKEENDKIDYLIEEEVFGCNSNPVINNEIDNIDINENSQIIEEKHNKINKNNNNNINKSYNDMSIIDKSINNNNPNKNPNLNSSYLLSCLSNNNEFIKAHLLISNSDEEVFNTVNSTDIYKRKGIFYLLLHNNLQMIQLSIASGVVLSDQTDIYGRNIIHYLTMKSDSTDVEMFKIIAHIIVLELKERHDDIVKYILKAFPKYNDDDHIKDYNNLSELEDFLKEMNFSKEKPLFDRLIDENDHKKDVSENEILEKYLKNKVKPSLILSNNNYYSYLKQHKKPIKTLINMKDIDGNTSLHYACVNNSYEMVDCLLYYGAQANIKNNSNYLPIDLTNLDKIKQLLLSKSIGNIFKSSSNLLINNKDLTVDNKKNQSILSSSSLLLIDNLSIERLSYMSDTQINKISYGVEKNNLLILLIIHNKFEVFRYLIENKSSSVLYKNSIGWTSLNYIIKYRRWLFFLFLYGNTHKEIDFTSEDISIEEVESLLFNRKYNLTAKEIVNDKGELNYKGESLCIIDHLTNNKISSLYQSVTENKGNLVLLRILVKLLERRNFLGEEVKKMKSLCFSTSIDYILNRKYEDKTENSLLIKSVIEGNYSITKYLLNDLPLYNINKYEVDKKKRNILHHSVINNSSPELIYSLIYNETDNKLGKTKDFKGKLPSDYDKSKAYTNYSMSIWEVIRLNDYDKVIDYLSSNQFVDLNLKSSNDLNTALHLCVINLYIKSFYAIHTHSERSNKSNRSLTKLDLTIKNKKEETVNDLITKVKSIKTRTILEKILNNDFNSLVELDEFENKKNLNQSLSYISKTKAEKIIEIVRKEVETKKINMKKIFESLDLNKNGKLEGFEFESLFTVLGFDITYDDVLIMMCYLDKNKDGYIDFEEFVNLIK